MAGDSGLAQGTVAWDLPGLGELYCIDDQYHAAMTKLDAALFALEPYRGNMSLPMRVIVANVFLVSF